MYHVTIHCVLNNHRIKCPTLTTGATFLLALGHERLTLASIQPLNNGIYRRYCFVQPDRLYDLAAYSEVYTSDRKLLACIDMAQERMS